MGALLDTLTADHFRKRPAMYAGSARFTELRWWLRGLEYGCTESNPGEPSELDGFREWLHMRFDGPGNVDWVSLIDLQFGHEAEATSKLFELLDEFLEDVATNGKDKILQDHANYERRRYEGLASSRLRKERPKWTPKLNPERAG